MKTKKIVTLHHSAISRKDLYEQFDIIKKNHIAKGWGDIGYHYFIEPSGQRKKGRAENMDGAHCYGHNENNIGICLGGNFSLEYPTREQEIDLTKLLNELRTRYIIKIEHHRDFKATQCPGNLLDTNWHKNKTMEYVEQNGEQYIRYTEPFNLALNIGDNEELRVLKNKGLPDIKPRIVTDMEEYEIYPLVSKSRMAIIVKELRDLMGF